ncbi:hypothetical protein TRIUR3_33741 [Triticum urartu]|uniref:Uncharacterized protein n=1 Tax=Triticum urartu TaxID=4572 RepID=M7YG12_TRIUA|nr:hypothetical protein TRIUR3_33741 [Triticum urartu]
MESTQSNTSVMNHFILVHGLCHGAWCWYKVVAALQAAGHRVTVVDLAASGAHPARIDEVHSFEEYSQPLLDAVAAAPEGGGERLILVGHSHGGLSLALAMERFPGKVAAAVFAAAGMPCVGKHMGVTTEEDPVMKDASLLTDTNYGSVKKVYVVAKADGSSTEEMQRWMVLLSPGTEVEEIAGADHAIMSSRPRELCDALEMLCRLKHLELQGVHRPKGQTAAVAIANLLCCCPVTGEIMLQASTKVGGVATASLSMIDRLPAALAAGMRARKPRVASTALATEVKKK